ncbi:MAG: prolyl oligopeptidase family serine peptidase [Fimbriimonas sp.]|nr:prolyl oligopeptidase family serine peptidase [Fimbriimonas sp.]
MILLASAFLSLTVVQTAEPIRITDGLAIRGVFRSGRLPVGFDSVQDLIVHGEWTMPAEGDTRPTPSGKEATWHKVHANKDGTFADLGSGYLAATVDVPEDKVMVLECAGPSVTYVNGVPRAGDPYSYGYLKLPVPLTKGANTLLFCVQRGQVKASLSEPRGPVQIETGDLTSPDILIGGSKQLLAGVVLLNNTVKDHRFKFLTRNSAGATQEGEADVPGLSIRKIPVKLQVPDGELGKEQKFDIEVTDGKTSDRATITLSVKPTNKPYKVTFLSKIDGSVQYYAVNPAQKPARNNALVLSLHGASVEAIGQASAYASKDWCTLVSPTNRRPYGFDWEDIGRLDALEVLDLAKHRYPHDPASIHLTGHSMGGHGTWSIGTLYPDLFASIAPSAGWISWWTYAEGYKPHDPTPVQSILLRSMAGGDTLARVTNTLEEKVFILHGDADDNVPVEEARTMKKALTDIHADFQYHEQPGAGHWWGLPNMGAACVDWPGIFDQIKASHLIRRDSIDFTTPCPSISSHDQWVTVLEQIQAMIPSNVKINVNAGTTKNVAALRIDRSLDSLTLDGQSLGRIDSGTQLILANGEWKRGALPDTDKSPGNSGPFKSVFQNRFVFVVATHGTPEENYWSLCKARYDAETLQYRGNGSVDIVTDREYRPSWARNVVVYGNLDNNSAYRALLSDCPVKFARNSVKVGDKVIAGLDLGGLLIYPHKVQSHWYMVGAITGTSVVGLRTTDRLGILGSGVSYPDWTIVSADILKKGDDGIRGCGFFGNDWQIDPGQTAWNNR